MKQGLFKTHRLSSLFGSGALLATVLMAACSNHNGGSGSTVSVTDIDGKSVTFNSKTGTVSALQLMTEPAGAGTTGLDFPNGFFSYQITGLGNGQSATVTVTLPAGSNPTQILQCINGSCSDLVAAGKASIAANVITLTLKDGEIATDTDGLSNGTISSAFAPAGASAGFNNKSGSTEPLYTYQWALKKVGGYFASLTGINFANDGNDLDVETVHTGTYTGGDGKQVKGAGVNVLVLDDGIDIRNEDLLDRVDLTQTRNFDFAATDSSNSEFGTIRDGNLLAKNDPTPVTKKLVEGVMTTVNVGASHGTNVAGIILASQNGKGVMGIAPAATLGGASFLSTLNPDTTEAYGGGVWAQKADVINASFGSNPTMPPEYEPETANQALRGLANLRSGKGAPFIKASGNEFGGSGGSNCTVADASPIKGIISCENPANDTETLEPNTIVVGAVNAAGQKSSYSNAGGVNWVMGLGGEYGNGGTFGEGVGTDGTDGPTIFSTDLRGCSRGYSNNLTTGDYAAVTNYLKGVAAGNSNCDYSYMNGTSAATPTVTGVVALMLSVNPNLGWRDVREILASTAKSLDSNYAMRVNVRPAPNSSVSPNFYLLATNAFATSDAQINSTCWADLGTGDKCAILDRGYQNVGGQGLTSLGGGTLQHSMWYGFGLADAAKAVAAAKSYTNYLRTTLLPTDQPDFKALATLSTITYGQVTEVSTPISIPAALGAHQIDQLQLRISADSACMGNIGFIVKKASSSAEVVLASPINTFSNRRQNEGGEYLDPVTQASNYTLGTYGYFGAPMATGDQYKVYVVARSPNTATDAPDYCGLTNTSAANLKIEWRILPRVLDKKDGSGVVSVGSVP